MLATGCCAVGLAIVPRTPIAATNRDALRGAVARVGFAVSLALIPASLLRLLDQLLALQSPGDPLLQGLTPLLTSTTWGTGFVWQTAGIGLTLVAFTLASWRAGPLWHWLLAAMGAVALCVTPALQGHAIGSETATMLAVIVDVTHLAAAGVWLGSLGVIGWLGLALPDGDGAVAPARAATADARLRLLVPLVPPLALSGAALLIGSGTVSSVLHLRSVSDLWTTEWGRYVAIKSALAAVVVALGAVNWRRRGPRIGTPDGVQSLRRTLLTELGIALVIVVVTAMLVITPLPGE